VCLLRSLIPAGPKSNHVILLSSTEMLEAISEPVKWMYGGYGSKVMDVLIKAAEYVEMPVRRSDDEPLQRLFVLVRSELNLDPKNIKQEQAKFWKRHPALIKVCCFVFFSCFLL
jgi:hypothetical protein